MSKHSVDSGPKVGTGYWMGRSNGKLLLSGEYFVLDGALALAIPSRLGQTMTVREKQTTDALLQWNSHDLEGNTWFAAQFALPSLDILQTEDVAAANRLQSIFRSIARQQPSFWQKSRQIEVTTCLEFPRLWGLGTSSTLLVNLARWSQTDAFQLLEDSFTGSGYDIACGLATQPLLYQMKKDRPHYVELPYRPSFSEHLYFVYLETKQDSRAGIARYREMVKQPDQWIAQISECTLALLQARELTEFEGGIRRHEEIVAQALQFPRAQERLFPDYWGQIKSLGAWGGDFVLATSNQSAKTTKKYFNEKGYSVVLSYKELLI